MDMSAHGYASIVNVLKQYQQSNMEIARFKCSFFEQMDSFSSEKKSFPILYAIPLDVSFEENIDSYTFRIYCVDRLSSDRANEETVLNKTLFVLRDITNWLRLSDNGLNVLNNPRPNPVNNFLVDYTAGWYADFEIESEAFTSDCSIPLLSNFQLTGITCDISYVAPFLTCETLSGCSTFLQLENRVTALESLTGNSVLISNGLNTYTGGTSTLPTINISAATLDNIIVSGIIETDLIQSISSSGNTILFNYNNAGGVLIGDNTYNSGQIYVEPSYIEISTYDNSGGIGIWTNNKGIYLSDNPYIINPFSVWSDSDFLIQAGTDIKFNSSQILGYTSSKTQLISGNELSFGIGGNGGIVDDIIIKDVSANPFTTLSNGSTVGVAINAHNSTINAGLSHVVIAAGSNIAATQSNTLYTQNFFATGNAIINGDVQIFGNVEVLGTATTLNTQTVQTQDNNLVLNYSGTHLSAIGGGLTIVSGQTSGLPSSFIIDSNGDWSANSKVYVSNLGINTSSISSPTDGDIWYDGSKFNFRESGTTRTIPTSYLTAYTTTVMCGYNNSSLARNQTYGFGSFQPIAITTSLSNQLRQFIAPIAGFVRGLDLTFVANTGASNEGVTISIYNLTQGTNTIVSSSFDLSGNFVSSNRGLALATNVGDVMQIRLIAPNWVTQPVSTYMSANVIFSNV